MANFGSRRGFADKLALPLMILAFLVVVGFLYWLNVTAEPTQVAIVEEEDPRQSTASAILNVDDFLTDAGQYRRRRKALEGAWKRRLGGHRPALSVVEVAGLVDEEAVVAIAGEALV